MRTTLINTMLCFLIVLIGIVYSSSVSVDNNDNEGNIDWVDFETLYPVDRLEARAAKSRFWKRVPSRKFWKRSIFQNEDMIK